MATLTMEAARAQCGRDTHIVGVIGSPVGHSLSPLLHNTAFAAQGLGGSWRSFAFEVAPGQAATALDAMRAAAITGLSVTMPHKADVAGLVDECSDEASQLRAVNCVQQQAGRLFGTNTDGEGFVASLARGAAFEPAGKCCVVIGAGGAARAVMLALARAGASDIAVVNRTPERAFEAADLAGDKGTVVPLTEHAIAAAVGGADLVVNATPVGMIGLTTRGNRPISEPVEWLVAPELLGPGQVAADLVYVPRPTAWLEQAGAAGATTLDGLGMLVHQAAAQLARWTGAPPALEAMWHAAEAAYSPGG